MTRLPPLCKFYQKNHVTSDEVPSGREGLGISDSAPSGLGSSERHRDAVVGALHSRFHEDPPCLLSAA